MVKKKKYPYFTRYSDEIGESLVMVNKYDVRDPLCEGQDRVVHLEPDIFKGKGYGCSFRT